MTEQELAGIRARVEAATEGPWESETQLVSDGRRNWGSSRHRRVSVRSEERRIMFTDITNQQVLADYNFIAHARSDIPKLLVEVERLQASEKQLLEAFGPIMAQIDKYEAMGRI